MRRLVPGLLDLLPILVVLAALATGPELLHDSDTGWHVRAGDLIWDAGSVPRGDPFSFSAEGRPWFAWEWLCAAGMSLLHRHGGLGGLVAVSALLLGLSFSAAQRLGLVLGGRPLLTFLITSLGATATTLHWLARPHLVSYPLVVLFVAVLEAGSAGRSPRLLLLLPVLTLLWCNLHGAFPVGLGLLGAYWIGGMLPGAPQRWSPRHLGWALAASLLVTTLNPYGLDLHRHLIEYVNQRAILEWIDEFRSPDFQSFAGRVLEIWLLGSALALPSLLQSRDWPRLCVLLGLTHMTLTSHRHVELLVLGTAPYLAAAFRPWPGFGWMRRFDTIEQSRGELWGPLLLGALTLSIVLAPGAWRAVPAYRFSGQLYPVQAAERLPGLGVRRVLSTDAYGGYLIYRLWPRLKVFIDGRSDFYATNGVLDEYLAMLRERPGWLDRIERHRPDAVLLPREHHALRWLLVSGGWVRSYEDATATLLLPNPEAPRSRTK
jgi:hypothetical protein